MNNTQSAQSHESKTAADLMAVVEGQCAHFAVVGVGVFFRDVLESAVRDVGVTRNTFHILTLLCLRQNLL